MDADLQFEFDAELWLWSARREAWTFVALPADASADIAEIAGDVPRGFGAVRVEVLLGAQTWRTSVFPDAARGVYVLPIKRTIREAHGVDVGDTVHVHLSVIP